jgi:putative membrane protein
VDPATGKVSRKGASPLSGTGTNTGLSAMDKQFMMTAAKDGMREVHMGQMAVQEGQSAEVKKLGNMIVADHTKANRELMEIATGRGVKPDLRHRMDKMSKKEMANFDQAWLAMMVNDHQKDIALYQTQAQQGNDPELKAFAKKTLPVLQKHLKAVQSAQKKMGGAMAPGATANTER